MALSMCPALSSWVTGHLPKNYRVLAIDLAEHGESRSTRDVWTMEEFARDVAAVLEAESVNTAVVAGHSLGGAVAVEVGRLLPDTVSHVVALDAALRETKQPITVFAIRDLVTQEAIDRYGDRLDIVLVDLGSHHFPVEAPEGTAKLLASVGTGGRSGLSR